MTLKSPITGMDWAYARSNKSNSNSKGSPNTVDPNTKYFRRQGFDVVEATTDNLSNLVEEHGEKTAFRVDGSGEINDTIRTPKQTAVFASQDSNSTFKLGSEFDGGNKLFQFDEGSTGWELRNIDVDTTNNGRGARMVTAFSGGTVRNVTVTGEIDDNDGQSKGFACTIPRGETIELLNYNLPDGASRTFSVPSYSDKQGVIMTSKSNGVLKMKGCEVGGFPSNGIYASGPRKRGNDGYAIIEDHTGYNSDRDQVRVGNNSIIRDSYLYSDRIKDGFNLLRGIWFRYTRGATVENTTIKTHTTDWASAINVDHTAGETNIRNCDVEVRSSDPRSRGVCGRTPSSQAGDNRGIHVEDTRFYGDGNCYDVILIQKGRPESTIENVDIDCPNATDLIDNRS